MDQRAGRSAEALASTWMESGAEECEDEGLEAVRPRMDGWEKMFVAVRTEVVVHHSRVVDIASAEVDGERDEEEDEEEAVDLAEGIHSYADGALVHVHRDCSLQQELAQVACHCEDESDRSREVSDPTQISSRNGSAKPDEASHARTAGVEDASGTASARAWGSPMDEVEDCVSSQVLDRMTKVSQLT